MSKISLWNYVKKIEVNYLKAREDWTRLQKELQTENERYEGTRWEMFTSEGRREEKEKHIKKINEIYEKLEKIREDFSKSVEKVQEDSDKVFDKVFRYNPDDVDTNGVTILQNGALRDNELMELAEKYRSKGNYTMYFLVAEKLKKEKPFEMLSDSEREAYSYYNKSHQRRTTREDHDCLEGFRDVCLKALRNEDYLSEGIAKVHEEFLERYEALSEDIVSEYSSPWE